ncbi:putative glycolipid-binding domain-containing protein [Bacillus sp. FSL W7-1360]
MYEVSLDGNGLTKEVKLEIDRSKQLVLKSNGEGKWFHDEGQEIKSLRGAIDVDISITPFSNSLPIRRLTWEKNQCREFQMVYIAVPHLEIQKVTQHYEYVREEKGLRYFRYQCRSYETMITVDEAGFVVEYPGVFCVR